MVDAVYGRVAACPAMALDRADQVSDRYDISMRPSRINHLETRATSYTIYAYNSPHNNGSQTRSSAKVSHHC